MNHHNPPPELRVFDLVARAFYAGFAASSNDFNQQAVNDEDPAFLEARQKELAWALNRFLQSECGHI